MAKFQQPYVLCPLIGQKSLLGVVDDVESDCVIATLGKNMIIRYKLQNQKQIHSWGTKDKLSSPVMYDRTSARYVGVFAHSQLRLWPGSEEHLDGVKKYRFQMQIYCVLEGIDEAGPVVVFQNGLATPLDVALETRKTAAVAAPLKPSELIQDCRLVVHEGIKQVAILTKTPKAEAWCYMVPVSEDWVSHRFEVVCDDAPDAKLAGHAFISDGQLCRLFTLWSDGRLLVQPAVAGGNMEVLAVVKAISTANPVAMLSLGPSHLAMFGADPSEEGAIVGIYNVRFGLMQCQQHFKLFNCPPCLWSCSTHLLLAVGSSLVVVPYRVEAERLSTVIGSHRPATLISQESREDVEVVVELRQVSWEKTSPAQRAHDVLRVPASLAQRLRQLEATGCPQATMLEEVLPELLDSGQVDSALWCLEHYKDVSERTLIDVLQFCLQRGAGVESLLAATLRTHFSDDVMLNEVRRLSLGQALEVLSLLVESLEDVDEASALHWITLLLDAYYQQYLLARDPQVKAVLTKTRGFIGDRLAHASDMKVMLQLVKALMSGKAVNQSQDLSNLYHIDYLRLY